jgi:hypothetical protein
MADRDIRENGCGLLHASLFNEACLEAVPFLHPRQ